MSAPSFQSGRFSACLDCRYIFNEPEQLDDSVHVIALHGYGMDAETMLRLTATWFPNYAITSIQAPHPFYRDVKTREVGYSWATHTQSEESVRLHHEMVLTVCERIEVPPARRVLIGFSQSVGLNYRLAATHTHAVRAVIGVCGGVPGNWETGDYHQVEAALLHVARTEDEIYPVNATRLYADRLRHRAADVEALEFPGGHRFPSLAAPAAKEWVRRKFAAGIYPQL